MTAVLQPHVASPRDECREVQRIVGGTRPASVEHNRIFQDTAGGVTELLQAVQEVGSSAKCVG